MGASSRIRITSYNVCYTKLLRMRSMHRTSGWRASSIVCDASIGDRTAPGVDHRGPRFKRRTPVAAGLGGRGGASMRVLPVRTALVCCRIAGDQAEPIRRITSYNVCYTKLLRLRRTPHFGIDQSRDQSRPECTGTRCSPSRRGGIQECEL